MAVRQKAGRNTATDVIVVGAGSAGAATVRRLVDAGLRVTVLEAGPEDAHAAIHDPTGNVLGLSKTEYDWAYEYVPQAHMDGRVILQPKGRTLGGSSAINALVYVRGEAADYEHWAALGAPGWDWASVEPYFRRLERYSEGAAGGRGVDGPVGVLRAPRISPVAEAWLEAAVQAGHRQVEDYNSGEMEGAARTQLTIANGRRASAWVAYVRPIERSARLKVMTRTTVTNLVFEGERVVGVDYVSERGGSKEKGRLLANREVVLSAGAVGSPQILMLSGIGDARELRQLGIAVKVDLPGVGRNFQDHPKMLMTYETYRPLPPLATALVEGNLFLKSRPGLVAPDLQAAMLNAVGPVAWRGAPKQGFTVASMVMHPLSRGRVTLRSTNPFDLPLLDPQFFAEPYDLEVLVDSVEPLRAIAAQAALRKFVKRQAQPGPELKTREELRRFARATTDSAHHPAGTAKMGVDSLAVVDPELRVYGVQGLRVADLSVTPALATGNTNGPAMMIGERAADFILGRREILTLEQSLKGRLP